MKLYENAFCGICKIVGHPRHDLHLDHHHQTFKARALLCRGCNLGIGSLYETEKTVSNLIPILDDFEERKPELYEKREDYRKAQLVPETPPDEKECTSCLQMVPFSQFYKGLAKYDLSNKCKTCKKNNMPSQVKAEKERLRHEGKKKCKDCRYIGPFEDFCKNENQCKKCRAKNNAMRDYEISEEKYNSLMAITQCPGCNRKFNKKPRGEGGIYRCIDHCHETDLVRGVLCRDCNCAIGSLKNSRTLLHEACVYLRKHADTPTPNNPLFDRLARKRRRLNTLDC